MTIVVALLLLRLRNSSLAWVVAVHATIVAYPFLLFTAIDLSFKQGVLLWVLGQLVPCVRDEVLRLVNSRNFDRRVLRLQTLNVVNVDWIKLLRIKGLHERIVTLGTFAQTLLGFLFERSQVFV